MTNVIPLLLAQGVEALREMSIMPRLVNSDYQSMAASEGDLIQVPIPSAITARTVTPAVTYAANVDSVPTKATVTLDFWREAPFQLSDKDAVEGGSRFRPMQASEAIKSLANAVDSYILGKHTGIFGAIGTAGTTPFAGTLTDAAQARELLNRQLAPVDNRRGVLDPLAETALLINTAVIKANERGDQGGIIAGTIGNKLGIDWFMDQNIPSYTPGTAWITGWTSDGSATIGTTTLAVVFTNSGSVKIGDIFQLTAGGLGYVVTAVATAVTATTLNLSFYPGLRNAVATAAVLIIGAGATAYTVNIVMHRDAFAWASRPLARSISGVGNVMSTPTDPISGIALRLELSRQYKQETFSYDILGGANLIRRELAIKVKG